MNLYGFAAGDPVNFSDPFGLCPPENADTWDCGSGFYARLIAEGKGVRILNEVGGWINSCVEDSRCGGMMASLLSLGAAAARGGSIGLSTRRVGRGLSVNQMNQQVKRGQAPRGITRVDKGKVKGEQDNVHFDDGSTLNRDGSWKHGERELTNQQREWLQNNGWKVPS